MVILYPTETLYALGVNALDPEELEKLYEIKGREAGKGASWLVPSIEEIEKYAEMNKAAVKIASRFLPGSLTLVLKAKDSVSSEVLQEDRTIGFRIPTDQIAIDLVKELGHPITCTSANRSGEPTFSTPKQILEQLGEKTKLIDRVIDDGPRNGLPSTVVRVIGDNVEVLREGAIPAEEVQKTAHC